MLIINQKNDNGITISWYDAIVHFFDADMFLFQVQLLVQTSNQHKKNCIEKKNEWGKLKSLPPVNFIFIFALWFSASWNGFKIVQRAFHHGSITFLEINLILNSWNNAVWNFLKKYLVKKIKKKSSTSSYYRKNQQPCIQSDY